VSRKRAHPVVRYEFYGSMKGRSLTVQEVIDVLSKIPEEQRRLSTSTEGCDCIDALIGVTVSFVDDEPSDVCFSRTLPGSGISLTKVDLDVK
jgi:hypothetical protein